ELGDNTRRSKLVLSFDDGYRDFLTTAVPLLKRHGLRVNQNIIPGCVETGQPPLNVMVQDFVGQAPKELVKKLHVEGFSASFDNRYGQRLSHFLKMRPKTEQDVIARELLPQLFDWKEFRPTPMLTLGEVRSLDEHEIGAHSYSH